MKKIIVTSLCVIFAAILLIVIFSAVAKNNDNNGAEENKITEKEKNVGKEKEKKEDKETKDDEDDDNYSSEKPTVYKPYERKKILLDEPNEVFEVDEDLVITLTGTKENYDTDRYTYTADIKLGENPVKAAVFNTEENRVIYSNNHGAEFFVDRIDNVYIVSSYMTSNMNGYSIAIFNTDGEVLKEFRDVILELSGNMVTISLKDVGSNKLITETRFTIKGKSINIEYEKAN